MEKSFFNNVKSEEFPIMENEFQITLTDTIQ